MPKYIQLVNYTQDGIEQIEETPERLEDAKALAEELGGEIEAYYLTLGQYDAAVIVDVPDAKTAAVGAIAQGQKGIIETETLRAFDEGEVEEIIGALPE